MQRVGVTRRRADCFLRLWLYVFLKDAQQRQQPLKPPLAAIAFPSNWVECSCREAAAVFYGDRDRGSDRSAGMMLDKLVALGLIRKQFDGNCTQIQIQSLPELLHRPVAETVAVLPDAFDPRSDAIPIANLLAHNYNWWSRNTNAMPYRIANILRDWAVLYGAGMRVLRRCDNQNPVGFYVIFPVARQSEIRFFNPPSQALHLSRITETDPFEAATPGDETCRTVFVRSWIIDREYQQAIIPFLQDAQMTLKAAQKDFPNLWDMYTLIIHPNYETLAQALGFQKTNVDPKLPIYWLYQSVDRFLAIEMIQLADRLTEA